MSAVEEATRSEAGRAAPGKTRVPIDRYTVAFAALVLFAGLLRFWDLGSRAMHHDESLHALYSWYLYVGRGYLHDPLMHGPFQFHNIALVYFLLGDSDYTARVGAAIFGTLAVALPFFLRPWLGRWGALAASAFLGFSPLVLYYSRFARGDIYILVWHLLMVIAMWRYFLSEDRRYLWLGAAALGLAFATKEVTYLTALIFGSYLLLVGWRELLPGIRRRFDFRTVGPRAGFLLLFGGLILPQGAAGVLLVLRLLGVDLAGLGAWQSPDQPEVALFLHAGADPARTFLVVAGTLLPLFLISIGVGLRWQPRVWLTAAGFFYVPFVLLYTTFFTNLPGFGSGIWGGLEYWIAQQPVARGSQPWFYYLLLLSIYEFLPGLLGLAGVIYFGVRRRLVDRFAGFLIWWLIGSFLLYAYAGEKMPWLSLHTILPLVLLAAKMLEEIVGRVPWRELWRGGGFFLVPLALLTLLALRALVGFLDALRPGPALLGQLFQMSGVAIVLAIILGAVYRLTQKLSLRLIGAAMAIGLLVMLAAFTVRAAWQSSFRYGDTPVEMMVYTQSSPEIPRLMREIERVAAESGQGKNFPVTVDASMGFTWPWAWYLRDYKNVDYPELTAGAEARGSMLLLNTNNRGAMEPYVAKYEAPQPYPHRWWFPEFYKESGVLEMIAKLLTPEGIAAGWKYFYARDPGAALGSSDGLAYYPKGTGAAVAQTGSGSPPQQATQTVPRPAAFTAEMVFGQRGSGPGQLLAPKGVAVDTRGNVYVVDSEAARVTKFDGAGRVLGQAGRRGSGDAEFTEPWGIAVDAGGNVYVADTWNHRVQKFDSELRFVAKWGSFLNVPAGGSASPGGFYGPRAIAVDAAGNLYVTDTGNKRIQKFTANGQFIAAFGTSGRGQGQFQEPVGLTIAPSGEILVADTWNRRVQRFDGEFRYLGEFPVAGWAGQSVPNKPYLAVDGAGNAVLTDPEGHRLLKYSPAGALLSVYGRVGSDLSSFNLPAVVTFDAQNRAYVSDSANARVLRLPPLE